MGAWCNRVSSSSHLPSSPLFLSTSSLTPGACMAAMEALHPLRAPTKHSNLDLYRATLAACMASALAFSPLHSSLTDSLAAGLGGGGGRFDANPPAGSGVVGAGWEADLPT